MSELRPMRPARTPLAAALPAVPEPAADGVPALLHDLRSPLTVIGGACHALRRAAPTAEAHWLVEQIEGEAARIAERVDRAGSLAGVGRPAVEPLRARVDLGEIAGEVVARFGVAAAGAGVHLDGPQPAPGGLPAVVEPPAVERLLENLIGTAIRHAGRGGRVTVEASRWGHAAMLRIRDDGPGMGDASRTVGWGIGLAVARGIARDHGGDIALEPSRVGAVFRIRIPLADGSVPPEGRAA